MNLRGAQRPIDTTTYGITLAPAWVTVTLWLPIVSLPLRCNLELLTLTVYDTVPGPLPFEPAVTTSHGTFADAVHPHPASVLTLTR
jgi:hypothetical protein